MDHFDFFDLKTDLADESKEICFRKPNTGRGIESSRRTADGIEIFTTFVTNENGERSSGRKRGRYVTVNTGRTALYDTATFEKVCIVLSGVISDFVKDTNGSFLLAGLGNPHITADSVGTHTVSNFIVTRHIKESSPELFSRFGFSETSAITPDVFGNTGVEAAEIIKGVVDDISPSCVIAIDSLASRHLSRLAATVQICDTGICPGSGVGNARTEISAATVGVPVIAIGIPTVVNATTLISDVLNECGISRHSVDSDTAARISDIAGDDCYVSPKDCEKDIRSISRMVGYSLNYAIHKGISFSEMRDFL